MNTAAPIIQTTALALNTSQADVPDWIQLTPPGPKVSGRDGRRWALNAADYVVAAFAQNAADLPVDFEHATQIKGAKGEAAPAVGWIKELEARNGAIWGRVDWTEAGHAAVASKGYRYVSPVFTYGRRNGEIQRMVSAGLTNQPNLELAALNSEAGLTDLEDQMDKDVLDALGLALNASSADAVTAINKLKSDEATARNRAETPDPSQFVPRADYDLALNKVRGFEQSEEQRKEQAITAAVDAAVEAGKIAPAAKDYHLAACRAQGGLDAFKSFMEASPSLTPNTDLDTKDPADVARNSKKLDADELAVCRQFGLTEDDFLASKTNKEV